MSSGSTVVDFGHDKNIFRASNTNGDHIIDVDLAAALKPKKRKVCRQDGSRNWPIIIDDSDSLKQRAPGEGPPKKQRRSQGIKEPLRKTPTSANGFIRVQELLRPSRKVIVISGAGISANAGYPTFQEMRKSKQTSFDRSLYSSPDETIRFHSTVCSMFEHLHSNSCKPTPFHKAMDKLAHERRLLHHITQNIDCIEQRLPDLDAKTIRLHSQIDQMRCQICNGVFKLQPQLFRGADLPGYPKCVGRSQARVSNRKRPLTIGTLKPDVLLYSEPHPDDNKVLEAIEDDLETCPDLVLVVGTKLEIPGAVLIATSFCDAARRRGGVTVWISKEEPPSRARNLFDYILQGDCDAVTWSHSSPQLVELPRGG